MPCTFAVRIAIQCRTPGAHIVLAERSEHYSIPPTVGMYVDVEIANKEVPIRKITLDRSPRERIAVCDLERFDVDFSVDELLIDLDVQGFTDVSIFLAEDYTVSYSPLAYKFEREGELNERQL